MPVTDELVDEFMSVHDRYAAIMAAYKGKKAPKPATAKRVRKWLERVCNPAACPDSLRYRVCGNGWAVNCARWVCKRISEYERKNHE